MLWVEVKETKEMRGEEKATEEAERIQNKSKHPTQGCWKKRQMRKHHQESIIVFTALLVWHTWGRLLKSKTWQVPISGPILIVFHLANRKPHVPKQMVFCLTCAGGVGQFPTGAPVSRQEREAAQT